MKPHRSRPRSIPPPSRTGTPFSLRHLGASCHQGNKPEGSNRLPLIPCEFGCFNFWVFLSFWCLNFGTLCTPRLYRCHRPLPFQIVFAFPLGRASGRAGWESRDVYLPPSIPAQRRGERSPQPLGGANPLPPTPLNTTPLPTAQHTYRTPGGTLRHRNTTTPTEH